MTFKDSKKLLRGLFREAGASVQSKSRQGTEYWQFPDGAIIIVPHNVTHPQAVGFARQVRERYGPTRSAEFSHLASGGAPRIDFERLSASEHAKGRLALMKRQAGVELREVLHCLRLPERVLWSDEHGSWLWVRDRLAVAVAESGDGFVITTVMWSTADLFVQHPRPEAARA